MKTSRHTLSILVENKPGVLLRVTALFSRRGFNIHSLAVGETENSAISRITVQVDSADVPFEQITKQLNKLVNVLKVVVMEEEDSIIHRVILLKIRSSQRERGQILQLVEMFRAHVIDVQPDSLVVEALGSNAKLEALYANLEPYGVTEIVQSGAVAIGRGARSITDQLKEK